MRLAAGNRDGSGKNRRIVQGSAAELDQSPLLNPAGLFILCQ
jgi:hypothetical protein